MRKRAALAMMLTAAMMGGVLTGCGGGNKAADVPAMASAEEPAVSDKAEENVRAESQEAARLAEAAVVIARMSRIEREATADGVAAETEEEPESTQADADPADKKPDADSGGRAGNNDNAGNAPSQGDSGEAAHEHVWKEHVATTQTWIPEIVVVDDYQTQNVAVGTQIVCNCGAVFNAVTEREACENHAVAHILAGEDDGHWVETIYEQQQVKVGTHEEDHGHYETSTYVDYYYCDCGATK